MTGEKSSSQPAESAEALRRRVDEAWMRLALDEAKKALRLSPPNPSVGAVIVREGRLVGAGFTQRTGGPHAEIMALRDAAARGESVEGATVYVTLEPCSHYGRTPPCALALIEAKVGRVVAATGDPNPKVHGRGLRMLEAAGIPTELGVLEAQAKEVNASFLTRMTRGTPWVRVKTAVTLDGRTALPDGRSKWITGEAARADGQLWRARAGAVLTGAGTVRADDPQMNVRLADQVRQPLRVVVDPRLETDPDAKILHSPGGPVLFVTAAAGEGAAARRAAVEAA
ncbi:bifunctional diaminohydroxyphosphoribosylaminopyrimidine deaminase/5-amino-6-(5-phosphoribosylamino)uracil reductase RibD, partial [Sutterella sp.]|uniref:bifunctional diaminohydroxyphosphoribosylaminopyrimidine deaminase/5-amino-6-(5-phosphoribosylamino)uracil reductase RibD n=1 Tax=Sutterella sp. TaxID=1981025 RepID=UPI003FD79C5F